MSKWYQRIYNQTVQSWPRRIGVALLIVGGIIITYANIYQWGMATFEDETVPIYQAVQKVVESLTTAGYGGHAPWTTVEMNFFVLFMNLTGVLLVFMAIPAFVIPLMQQVFESAPPKRSNLTNHVIIGSYSAQDEVLRKELEDAEIPYLYVDSDPDLVTDLTENGINAIYGDPERTDILSAANAGEARALVADVDDKTNPTVILSANRINPEMRIVSVVHDREDEPIHQFAGADEVVQSKRMLGRSLAMRAMKSPAERLREAIEVETDLEIVELLVEEDSSLAGKTLDEASIFDELEITVIGGWFGGKFLISPPSSTTIVDNSILLVAGRHEDLSEVPARPLPSHRRHPSRVIVCGYGYVGQTVVERLRSKDISAEVVDIESKDGVDVVGDITNSRTLSKVNIDNSRAIVLALNDDIQAIYASILIKQLTPDVEIIVRANNLENVWKLYNAGADYVLSLPTVAGEVLASSLIKETEILTPEHEFEFTRITVSEIADQRLGEVNLRAQTGCKIIAVERNGQLVLNLEPDFVVEENDILVIVGSVEGIKQCTNLV